MRSPLLLLLSLFIFSTTFSQAKQKVDVADTTKKIETAETACGQCMFGLEGKTCDLAVRINGKAYFVDGTKIDDHGDAHAEDGFCNAIRKAKIQGEITNERFKVTYFKLMKEEQAKK